MKTCPVCDTDYPDRHSTCPTDGAVLIETREFAPGSLVRGKYRIERKLGQGGMGTVYLAEHLLLGGRVALKFLAPELSRNPQFVKRFRNEARAAFQLRHPNIVEVMDLDQAEDGSLFIAMEYVNGPDLRAAIEGARGGMPVERALAIARGVACGLGAAHARGTIHRDIKPENILLTSAAGREEQAKVLDFGIAAMLEGATAVSRTRGLMLTPEYASPEQWRGTPAAELDGRTDLYALGCVFYEMLTGRTPFHAHNMEGWMFQHLQEAPQPPSRIRAELAKWPELDGLVMRLLAKDRGLRPADVWQFVAELDGAREPVKPAPAPEPAPRPAPGPRPQPAPAPEPIPPRRVEKPRGRAMAVITAMVAIGVILGFAVWYGSGSKGREVRQEVESCSSGDSGACSSAAYAYRTGEGVTRDYAESAMLETTACGKGYWLGCARLQQLGDLYKNGEGTPKDEARAAALYGQACDGGDANGCASLGAFYRAAAGGLAKDNGKAEALFQKACSIATARGASTGCDEFRELKATAALDEPDGSSSAAKKQREAAAEKALEQ